MSSSLRGYERHESDYYVTPIDKIENFIDEFLKYESTAFDNGIILDPTSGGDSKNPMSYPTAIKNKLNIYTFLLINIRRITNVPTNVQL